MHGSFTDTVPKLACACPLYETPALVIEMPVIRWRIHGLAKAAAARSEGFAR
jgi:hypothetical protein